MRQASTSKDTFDRVGALHLPGFFRQEEIDWYSEHFASTLDRGAVSPIWKNEFGFRRQALPFFEHAGDSYHGLATHKVLHETMRDLLDADATFTSAEGIDHSMNTIWHYDGAPPESEVEAYAKAIIFLDPVGPLTGSISVLAGSHRDGAREIFDTNPAAYLALGPTSDGVVSYTINPGDLLVLNVKTLHAVFARNNRRRAIYMNFVNQEVLRRSKARVGAEDKAAMIGRMLHEIEDMVIKISDTALETNERRYWTLAA
jgi:ectoine hydroxylase-related dioxygenase (phytanoyl-CoA dioxygenase family)